MREVEFFGHLGAYLSGVAVDGLAAAEDDVDLAQLAYGLREGIGGGQGVGACKAGVAEDEAVVGATGAGVFDNLGGTLRAHGDDGDMAAGHAVFDLQGHLECLEVFGVEDGGQGGTVDGAVGVHGVSAHVVCVGHLLGKYHYFEFRHGVYF